MKKEWWILIIVVLLPMVLVLGTGIFNYLTETRTTKEIYLDMVKKEAFHNRIDDIYRQKRNHNVLTLKGGERGDLYTVYPTWEHKFMIGDSVSKDSGSLKLEHYRDGKLLEVLDYNDVYIR